MMTAERAVGCYNTFKFALGTGEIFHAVAHNPVGEISVFMNWFHPAVSLTAVVMMHMAEDGGLHHSWAWLQSIGVPQKREGRKCKVHRGDIVRESRATQSLIQRNKALHGRREHYLIKLGEVGPLGVVDPLTMFRCYLKTHLGTTAT